MRLEKRAPLKHDRSFDTPLSLLLVSAGVFAKSNLHPIVVDAIRDHLEDLDVSLNFPARHNKGSVHDLPKRPLWDLIGIDRLQTPGCQMKDMGIVFPMMPCGLF